jgi:aspartate/methionine/tyrosine aminotransferase
MARKEYEFERKNRHFDALFATPDLRWLGQNTNHFPSHPAVREALIGSIEREEYHAYAPPAGLEELRALILDDLGLEDAAAYVTDGAIEGLYHACRTLCAPGGTFVTTEPGWKWPIAFARSSGAEVIELPIYDPARGYRLTPDQLAAAVGQDTRLIYLIDPNNPLGVSYSAADVRAIAGVARGAGAYLIHDCTYRHFADDHTLAARFYPERTITTYSFSKWLGLAGLRIGALVAHPDLIERLAAAPPNNLGSSVVAQRAAIAGLKIKAEWFPEVQRHQREHQAMIRDAALAVEGLCVPVFPSQGNFMVVDCHAAGVHPDALCDAFRERRILIRQASYHTWRYADRFVKISTTVPRAWIEELTALLPAAVEEARGRRRSGALY